MLSEPQLKHEDAGEDREGERKHLGYDGMRESGMVWTPSEERAFFKRVLKVVNDFEPFGIELGTPDGAPLDEWETEARAIESVLIKRGRIEFDDLRTIWLNYFNDDLTGSENAVQPFLNALNDLVPQNPT